jgi:hypothetical protein
LILREGEKVEKVVKEKKRKRVKKGSYYLRFFRGGGGR